jgi:cytochrome bd-type quinol oxidase subunit 2
MDYEIIKTLLVVVMVMNCIAMLTMLLSKDLDRLQKTAHSLLIWFLPLLGIVIVVVLMVLRRAEPRGLSCNHLKDAENFKQYGSDVPD